jgi:hypothetical protein
MEGKIVLTIGKIQPLENIKKKILNLNKKTCFLFLSSFFMKNWSMSPILNNPLMFNILRREASGVVLC